MNSLRKPRLSDVPETMLWTLHSRANEARRSDGAIHDPKAIEIYDRIDYDFQRSFGPSEPSLALRATAFDRSLRAFLQRHPLCSIVNLGEGLETQRFRIRAPGATWFSVDLPDAMVVRETFIEADEQHRHIACSASDTRWFDAIPRDRPVYISAQGLFMYFDESSVKQLLRGIAQEFPDSQLIFDAIPRWISRASLLGRGLPRTLYYKTPVMPWGVNRVAIKPLLRRWLGGGIRVKLRDYPPFPRGPARLASAALPLFPAAQWLSPTIVELSLGAP